MDATRGFSEAAEPYRFTFDDVLRMVDTGILPEDARVELIEGELVRMSPQSVPHARLLRWFVKIFVRQLSDDWEVAPQSPAILEPQSAPEPDIYIFPSSVRDTELKGSDIVLAIEVSISSLAFNLKRKAALYARFGVQEYWVVDVIGRRIVVHREPTPGGFESIEAIGSDEEIAPLAFPGIVVRVADLPSAET